MYAGNNWEGQVKSNKICKMEINFKRNYVETKQKQQHKVTNLPFSLSFHLLQSTPPGEHLPENGHILFKRSTTIAVYQRTPDIAVFNQ